MKFIIVSILLIGLALPFVGCHGIQTTQRDQTISASGSINISESDKAQIIDRETKTNEYEKTRELDKLREILAADYVAFFGMRTMTRDDVIRSQQTAVLKSYRMSNIRVKPIAKDAVVIYYILEQDGVGADGAKWDPKVAAAATYTKRNGVWYSVFYQESVIAK